MNFFSRHRTALGLFALALAAVLTFAFCLFSLPQATAHSLKLTVVIDAGHGGVDGGVVGTVSGVKESDVNLAISRILQSKFEEAGFAVVQTRPTEAGLYGLATAGFKRRDMEKRAEIIHGSNACAVVSVHQNFFSLTSRRGAQVFFRETNEGSKRLASHVQTALNAMPECVKKAQPLAGDYFMLNCSDVPSVIVECGFLSNPEDEALLLSDGYRDKLAETIAAGVISFLSDEANLYLYR